MLMNSADGFYTSCLTTHSSPHTQHKLDQENRRLGKLEKAPEYFGTFYEQTDWLII